MLGASLTAAETVKKKGETRQHVGPSGKVYKSDHDLTPAERKQIDAYDLSQQGSVKLGGKFDPTIKTENQPSGGLFAKTGTATKEGLAEAEKYATSKGVNLKPGQSSAMQRKAIGNVASAKAADLIEPVTGPASDFLANLATWIDPLAGFAEKKKPGSVKGAAKGLLEGIVTGPIQTVTSAGILTDPTATLAERGLSGAELARDALLATTHITLPKVGGALKKIFKGAEKAAVLEKGAFVPKEQPGYFSPETLADSNIKVKVSKGKAVRETPTETVKPTQGQKEPLTLVHLTNPEAKQGIISGGFNTKSFGRTSKRLGMKYEQDPRGISFVVADGPVDKAQWSKLRGESADAVYAQPSFTKPLDIPSWEFDVQWKRRLHEQYGTNGDGALLTKKLKSDGYDAIITRDTKGNIEEVVALDLAKVRPISEYPNGIKNPNVENAPRDVPVSSGGNMGLQAQGAKEGLGNPRGFGENGIRPNLEERVQKAPTPNTPKPIEAPQKPVQSPETASVTGLANQVQDREALNGIINEVEPTKGKGAEDWQGVGKKSVDAGEIDPEQLAARIGSGEEELTGKKVGALLEGKRKLMNALNSAKPGEEYLKAKEKLDTYLQNVQQGKGRWSDVGRALQAGTELDTGNFAQVIEAVQKQGAKLNPKMEQQFRDMTEKVKAAEAKLSETERLLKEEQAKRTTASQAKKSPRFSKEALDEELDQLLKEFVQKTAKASAGIDPELLPIMGRIAVNYMKRGVNTLDDVVAAVQSHFKEATYEDIVSGIDAATKGTTRTRSELQKEITRLKSQAKSDVKARTQIKSLQEQLRTGDYEVPTKRESTITKRVEDLRLERDLLSNEVKSRVGETKPRTGWQTVTNVLNAPKSIKSSIDISAAGRQGWFLGAANPDKIPAAFADQLKAMASPKGALKAQNALLERPNASKYKRMGLYIAPLEGHGEEAFKGTVFPKWSKLNPFQGSSRAYTAYLNRMRVDVADRLIKWAGPNATDDDLKVIGNFINTASGRGGKSIHLEGKIAESLNNVFFSPRFVASRFELALGQPLMTAQGKLGKSLKARALVAQQYAATLGTIGSIVALAKHMNPDMNTTDPTKPDYMSPKIGDTKIDVLAGLRQTVNLGAKLLDRDRNEFQKGADVGRFIRSKASPAAGSAYSLYTGKDYIGQPYGIKDALTDLVSPLSVQELVEGAKKDGWNQDDFLGMLNFLGFNTQTYKPKEDKKEHPN